MCVYVLYVYYMYYVCTNDTNMIPVNMAVPVYIIVSQTIMFLYESVEHVGMYSK